MVTGGAKKAAPARAILLKYGIEIDDAANGIFLPTVRNVSNAAYHPTLHTKKYYDTVNEMLKEATSEQEVRDILGRIVEGLSKGNFP
ncbi:MAG: AHH domain-containing protein [Lachnospiraceae bacterium]|nr:AHH domain-containing protein [Lachnospiraceae bacterium]MBP5263451.1 AHH domain-containing protein [Lachnospiraceae bacterium]